MVTVVIKNNNENNVIQLTWENLWKELKDIPNAELLVEDDWLDSLKKVKTPYVCFVESDCLVSPGYFSSQIDLFEKDSKSGSRRLAMLSSAVAVNNWDNKFYGYELGGAYTQGVIPVTQPKSKQMYPVQIGYMPGAIIRVTMLKKIFKTIKRIPDDNLVYLSAKLSLGFWQQGGEWDAKHPEGQLGNRVHINPDTTYVTTEDYVNDIGIYLNQFIKAKELVNLFKKEQI